MYHLAIFRPHNNDFAYIPEIFEQRSFDTLDELITEVEHWSKRQAQDDVEDIYTPEMKFAAFSAEGDIQNDIEQLSYDIYRLAKEKFLEARRTRIKQAKEESSLEARRAQYEELKKEFG